MTDDIGPEDLDLRLVRCFAMVAERRHFGRAAEALHVTQSSLSRQIQRLERQVGARLLDRTPQGTRLTEAGEVFLPLATGLLRSGARAAARARAAAEPGRITVGYIDNIPVTAAVRELRRRRPDIEVTTRHLGWNEVREALLDRRADAVLTRLPFPTDGLRVTVLYDEPRVLLVAADHRLAGRESITLADIADEPLPRAADPSWNAFWRVDPRPDGRRAPGGPFVETVQDKLELVACGEAVAIIPAVGVDGAAGAVYRTDLTTVPIADIEPSHVVLATRAGDRNRLLAELLRCAEAALVPAGERA